MSQISRLQFCTCANPPVLYCCKNEENRCNKYKKGKGVQFYRFPTDPERKSKWVSAMNCKDWEPTEYSWICSEHFVSGSKSNDFLAPNYVPTIFKHIDSSSKHRVQSRMVSFNSRQSMKRRRIDNEASSSASISEVVETVDDIDSNSPMLYEEDGNIAVTEEQLVSSVHDKLEAMKCKALQKELDQVQKEKDDLRRVYDELKTNVCCVWRKISKMITKRSSIIKGYHHILC